MTKHIPSLNGLRAISVFCILIAHVQIMNLHLPNGPGGQVGVSIFFVISGFLITLLMLKEETETGTISLKSFFIRRSLRIFPAFYGLLFVYFVLQLLGVLNFSLTSWLSSLTYTKYFFLAGQKDWETGHLWTLSVEESFYLLWPLVFIYLKNFRVAFAWLVIVVVPMVRLFSDVSVMHLFTRADALMWGCLFALYYPQITNWVSGKKGIVLMLPFLLLGFCLVCKRLLPIANADLKEQVALAFFGSFGLVTNMAISFVLMVSVTFRNNLYFHFLNWRPVDFLGRISYSIYLWQQLFFSKKMVPLSNLPVNLVCIFAVALLSYYGIEKPFLKLKSRFGKKQQPVNYSEKHKPLQVT